MADFPYSYLRIAGVKALKECRLDRLGRVNVICGRNNSGKSTLLEGIVARDARFPGIVIDESRTDQLFRTLWQSGGWDKRETESREGYLLKNLVKRVLARPRVVFLNEAQSFIKEVEELYQASQLRQWAFSANRINDLFHGWMRNDLHSVLVPPKRQIETQRGVAAGDDIRPHGAGILNFLFFAKNQPISSTEWRTYSAIASAFESISNGYSFDVFISHGNSLDLRFALNKGTWIAANDCGLGLQDLLVLLYFAIAPGFVVVAIEEPESHLHPDMQRRLLGFLKAQEDRQFFISTHSNVFLNNVYVDRVFFTTFRDEVRVDDATSRASMLDDLGYSVADNLVTDVVVLVEGPTDTPVVEELLLKRGVLPKFDVKIWPLGGDIMDQVDLSLLTQSHKVVALLDRDPGSSKVRKRFRQRCDEVGIQVIQLKRYAIENYFTVAALRAVFQGQVPSVLTAIDPAVSLESQIGINVKRNNRKLARELTLDDIASSDLGKFLDVVASLCEASAHERGAA